MAEPPSKRPKMTDSTPDSSTTSFHFEKRELVTLIVGKAKHEMVVHATYLARNSDFFKTALKKEWLEGQIRSITLPMETRRDITAYLAFTYGKELPTACVAAGDTELSGIDNPWMLLTRLYIMGDRLMDNAIKNAVIKEIYRLSKIKLADGGRECPGEDVVNKIYEATSEGDAARRFLVDMYAERSLTDWFDGGFNSDFIHDLVVALVDRRDPTSFKNLDMKCYMV